ncbi:MAG: tetratricopeptide repeat protein [Holosporaceae bacterium]|jgi:Flp pilus assembly protein TadD|nr:tetratricopeptide repeat protein [Holosporaceae bacterium]
MNRKALILLATSLLGGCTGENIEESAAPMIRIAKKARKSGNAEAAISFYKKALATDPDNSEAVLGLAEAYIDLKILDAAAEYIKQAEDTDGHNSAKSSYLRGKICLLSGDTDGAEKEFLKSTSTDSLNALGAVYDGKGKHKKAQSLYKQVISKDPGYIDAYNNMGLSLMLSDKYREAIFYLESACALPEANVTYRSNLALAYGLSGNIEKAKEVYSQDFEGAELQKKISSLEDIVAAKQK